MLLLGIPVKAVRIALRFNFYLYDTVDEKR